MNELVAYDLYKRPNGLLYRVPLYAALHWRVEFYDEYLQRWTLSSYTVVGIITSNASTLVARNVVFKASLCSQ